MAIGAEKTNRSLLWFLGLLLLVLGVAGVVVGSGLVDRVAGTSLADSSLLPSELQDFWTEQSAWFWPVVALVALLLGFLGLRLLLAQLGTDRVGRLPLLDDPDAGRTVLSSSALTEAVEDEVEAWPGVASCSASLVRPKRQTTLRVRVRTTDRADVREVRRRLAEETVPHVREALDGAVDVDVLVELEPQPSKQARELV